MPVFIVIILYRMQRGPAFRRPARPPFIAAQDLDGLRQLARQPESRSPERGTMETAPQNLDEPPTA